MACQPFFLFSDYFYLNFFAVNYFRHTQNLDYYNGRLTYCLHNFKNFDNFPHFSLFWSISSESIHKFSVTNLLNEDFLVNRNTMLLHVTKPVISENYPSIKRFPDNTFQNIYLFPNNNDKNLHIIACYCVFQVVFFLIYKTSFVSNQLLICVIICFSTS